jgi:hypothetical protein
MALGCEMHDDVRLKTNKGISNGDTVADVILNKRKSLVARDRPEGSKVSRVSKLIINKNLRSRPGYNSS